MSLTKGVYSIRFVPPGMEPPFMGGMYATPKGYGEPIYGEALGPSATGNQTWQLNPCNDGEPNTFIITTPQWPKLPFSIQGPGPVLPGWGLVGDVPTGRHDNVLLKVSDVKWRIELAEDGKTYTISPAETDGRVGVSFYVDLDSRSETLYIKTIPVIRDPPPAPRWEFTLSN
ncbi:hypothetical protein CVT24_004391 [Panaeolus cyanescens]|uniref:Uncharacterized protein n=1 Tax=Panaeolus cyanescens TaxID=181874 RepID=A0A409YBH5_9AGAR|nr:hypothetical protein CVT24_004391 [Panaeolus cyanescens]